MRQKRQQIALSASQLQALEKLARDSLPNESCAFLLGHAGTTADTESGGSSNVLVQVKEILPMANADSSSVSFTISPDETLRAYQLAEERGLQVAGIFHSHPSLPAPSSTDARFMEVNPVVWVIYSTTVNRFGAWMSGHHGIEKVEMVTVTA
jgi:proteasome lid subunit RPN8/RPN11